MNISYTGLFGSLGSLLWWVCECLACAVEELASLHGKGMHGHAERNGNSCVAGNQLFPSTAHGSNTSLALRA